MEAPGAAGARVANRLGQPINRQGFTIIPYLDPFTDNWLDLDPQGSERPCGDCLQQHDGGARFGRGGEGQICHAYRLSLVCPCHAAGWRGAPLGAEVFDDSGRAVGAVGQGGLLYARVPQADGSVSVVWGERSGQRCRLAYAIRGDAAQQVSRGTPHQVCRPGIKEK